MEAEMSELKIEGHIETFLKSIEKWDGENPTFNEACAGAVLHAALCGEDVKKMLRRIADDTETGFSSVRRYAMGAAKPVRFIRQIVVAAFAKELRPIYERYRQEQEEAHIAFRCLNWAANAVGVAMTEREKLAPGTTPDVPPKDPPDRDD